MKDDYNQKLQQTVEQVDEFKAELEKSQQEKQSKTEKLCKQQIDDKDEEIGDLNTLVGKLQDKTKEQRGQVNALKEDTATLTAQADEKDRTIAQLVKEL